MWNLIIFVITLIIGIIHGVYIDPSFNILISWILIGIWIVFTLKFFEKVRKHKEYHSPQNTAFFVFLPLIVGIYYSFWSNYTGLLGENILGDINISLNWWSILFGFPYIVYSFFSLYYMFRKYISVYFGTKSIKARTFGFFIGFSTIFTIVVYWIYFFNYFNQQESLLIPTNYSVNFFLILDLIITGFIVFIPGFLGKKIAMPQISPEYVTTRTRSINQTVGTQNNPIPRRQRYNTVPSPAVSTRSSRTSTSTKRAKANKPKAARMPTTIKSQKPKSNVNFEKLKPKGVNLTKDDFRCIFCFELPKYPEDNNRGIIICPECRYPAHADEFKEWTKNSSLCSRCDAPLPIRYIRNPKIIPTKLYVKVIRMFAK